MFAGIYENLSLGLPLEYAPIFGDLRGLLALENSSGCKSGRKPERLEALVTGARVGATPTDVYGTAWGQVLAGIDPTALTVSGHPSITIPDGIPDSRV